MGRLTRRLSASEGGVVELIIDELIERLAPATGSPVHDASALHILRRMEAKLDGAIERGDRKMSELSDKLARVETDLADHKDKLQKLVDFANGVPGMIQAAVDKFKADNPDVATAADLSALDDVAGQIESETASIVNVLPAQPPAPVEQPPAPEGDQAPAAVE